MRLSARACAAGVVLFLSGCSLFRWSGYREAEPTRAGDWSAADLFVSTGPARSRPAPLPELGQLPETLYYSDLGPDEIDVSGYSAQQKYNYEIFRDLCSRCHTLARAVNSPVQSRTYWRFHVARMSVHSRVNHMGPLPADQVKAVIDFLEYDARIRKIENRREFEERTDELKRRFDPLLEKFIKQGR